jgi:hypothetical protein
MNSLDQAVERVLGWSAARQRDRTAVLELLDALVKDCERAVAVWQDYLRNPGAPGDAFSLVSWMGAARVKNLHEINLDAKGRILRLCELADPRIARFVLLEDDLIEMAFRHLNPDETGPQAAQTATQRMDERIKHLRSLAERIRTKPAAAAVKKPAIAKAAGKAPKKPAAKTAKKPAPPKKKKR